MDTLFHRFAGIVNGVFKGFDRQIKKALKLPLISQFADFVLDMGYTSGYTSQGTHQGTHQMGVHIREKKC